MTHRDEMQRRVDAVIEQHVIAPMNELLIALSDDAQLGREERYDLQQQLRNAIASASADAGERFQTVTVKPALTRFSAIGWPMPPRPRKAICMRIP